MSTTNHTVNYELSQYIGTDVTSYLSNYNSDMYKIDAQLKDNADDAVEAKSDAATAVATSTTAASNASAAVSTANAANTTAEAAQTAATAAQTAAGAAQTTAEAALAASASNTIGNLAPAYDPTLTYAVDDLVTYIDPETNQGKLYKCIVAIATPEAFNINKWDDVTASEAFAPEDFREIASLTTDGVKSYNDIMQYFFENTTTEQREHSIMELDYASGAHEVYDCVETDENGMKFGRIDVNTSFIVRIMTIGRVSNNYYGRIVSFANNGTVTVDQSVSTYVPAANAIIFRLLKR